MNPIPPFLGGQGRRGCDIRDDGSFLALCMLAILAAAVGYLVRYLTT